MIQYKALAYIGLAWLDYLGCYSSEAEAFDALMWSLLGQLSDVEEEDREAFEEAFWFDSRIEQIAI